MSQRRPILSKTESYSQKAEPRNTPPGEKNNPYSFGVAKERLFKKLESTLSRSFQLPKAAKPRNVIVTKMTLHPAYLAKSYFPEVLFNQYNLQNLGSKEVFIKPDVQVTKKKKDKISSSQYFIAGQEKDIQRLINDVSSGSMDTACEYDFTKFEDIQLFERNDKLMPSLRMIDEQAHSQRMRYEVVLHASKLDDDIIHSFIHYIKTLGGIVYGNKIRTIKGLTFCFIELENSNIPSLADFSFVRVVRLIPELKIPNSVNALLENEEQFQISNKTESYSDASHSNIAIFDAGLFPEDCENKAIRYFDLTNQEIDCEDNLLHGSLVTSALIYGEASDYNLSDNPILNVDHFKVYSQLDILDIGLVNVLDRIESVIKSKKYKFANISLGPQIPCPDDEPSLWTATLDDLAADGDILITVAVGNNGYYLETELDHDLARIQSPADMLNGISIGAADSKGKDWKRASYSCVGPGRRPGYVKPDALYFGGDDEEKLELICLRSYEIKRITGTSFAAPLVTRTAALIDVATNGALNVATIRALLIHSTGRNKADRSQCGWGLINGNVSDILYCSDNQVTFIYQGTLKSASGIRAAVPFPNELSDMPGKIALDATLCFYTDVDQQHTASYTKAGIEVTFRPDFHKYSGDSGEANTRALFTKSNILGSEDTLRRDAHKWETCYKVHDNLMTSSLRDPIFDIKYLTREEGHGKSAADMRNLPPLHYSLVVSISFNKEYDVYGAIRKQYSLLSPLDINLDATVNV